MKNHLRYMLAFRLRTQAHESWPHDAAMLQLSKQHFDRARNEEATQRPDVRYQTFIAACDAIIATNAKSQNPRKRV